MYRNNHEESIIDLFCVLQHMWIGVCAEPKLEVTLVAFEISEIEG